MIVQKEKKNKKDFGIYIKGYQLESHNSLVNKQVQLFAVLAAVSDNFDQVLDALNVLINVKFIVI